MCSLKIFTFEIALRKMQSFYLRIGYEEKN